MGDYGVIKQEETKEITMALKAGEGFWFMFRQTEAVYTRVCGQGSGWKQRRIEQGYANTLWINSRLCPEDVFPLCDRLKDKTTPLGGFTGFILVGTLQMQNHQNNTQMFTHLLVVVPIGLLDSYKMFYLPAIKQYNTFSVTTKSRVGEAR